MDCIKKAVKAGIWNGICPQWFMLKDDVPLNDQDSKLVIFLPVENEKMESYFNMKFEDGREYVVRLHEQNVYRSFYTDTKICCSNIFTTARSYNVSKVVDRVDSFLGHCPFLAHDSNKL